MSALRLSMSLDMKYGKPQFANDTYLPASRMVTAELGSSRLARAAAVAPAATPPIITIRFPVCSNVQLLVNYKVIYGK